MTEHSIFFEFTESFQSNMITNYSTSKSMILNKQSKTKIKPTEEVLSVKLLPVWVPTPECNKTLIALSIKR